MSRQSKKPLYDKPWKRYERDTRAERDLGYGRLLDYGHKHNVTMAWNFNKDATRDQIFLLKVGDKEVFLDAEEVMKYLRWV